MCQYVCTCEYKLNSIYSKTPSEEEVKRLWGLGRWFSGLSTENKAHASPSVKVLQEGHAIFFLFFFWDNHILSFSQYMTTTWLILILFLIHTIQASIKVGRRSIFFLFFLLKCFKTLHFKEEAFLTHFIF